MDRITNTYTLLIPHSELKRNKKVATLLFHIMSFVCRVISPTWAVIGYIPPLPKRNRIPKRGERLFVKRLTLLGITHGNGYMVYYSVITEKNVMR